MADPTPDASVPAEPGPAHGAPGPPVHYGGQAVLEGVMMRGRESWAVAVRRPEGEIYVEERALRPLSARYPLFRLPFFRGVGVLGDSLALGMRALAISGNQSLEPEEQMTDKQMKVSLGVGAVFFSFLFILLPATGTNWLSSRIPDNFTFNLVEGLARLAFFLLYILAISRLRDIRRVFEYHGAEHMAIHCHEAGKPLTPANVAGFPTLHVRCGTNFLLILFAVMLVVFTLAFSLLGRPPLLVRVTAHLLAVPVIVGIAYEGIRLGAGRERSRFVQALMRPGLWLQMLTTKPPDGEQIEVAIRALQHVLPEAERAAVPPLPSAVVTADLPPAFRTEPSDAASGRPAPADHAPMRPDTPATDDAQG
jgi:uncharacterized protein YqhQ